MPGDHAVWAFCAWSNGTGWSPRSVGDFLCFSVLISIHGVVAFVWYYCLLVWNRCDRTYGIDPTPVQNIGHTATTTTSLVVVLVLLLARSMIIIMIEFHSIHYSNSMINLPSIIQWFICYLIIYSVDLSNHSIKLSMKMNDSLVYQYHLWYGNDSDSLESGLD